MHHKNGLSIFSVFITEKFSWVDLNLDFNIWQILILSPHHNTANWLYQMFFHYSNLYWDWNKEIDDPNNRHNTFLLVLHKRQLAVELFVRQFCQLSFDSLLLENLQTFQFDESVFEIELRLELKLDNVQMMNYHQPLLLLRKWFLRDLKK